MEYKLEALSESDRTAVVDIINYYVENSFAAYMETQVPYDIFDRFLEAIGDYPAVAAKTESGETIGFGFLRPYRQGSTFQRTAEITYFIHPDHTGKGLGTLILNRFEGEAKAREIDIFLASISSRNEQSIEFHKKHGFVECGRFKEIGIKRGTAFDMVWMQKAL